MKPLLVIKRPTERPPLASMSSETYIVEANARLDDPVKIDFAEGFSR